MALSLKNLEKSLRLVDTVDIFSEKCNTKYLQNVSLYIGQENMKQFYDNSSDNNCNSERKQNNEEDDVEEVSSKSLGFICTSCKETFDSLSCQRQHFKLDWHKFNVKQKSIGKKTISEEEFEIEVSGELSSISGSESDSSGLGVSSEEEQEARNEVSSSRNIFLNHPYKIFFKSNDGDVLFSIYRNVLQSPAQREILNHGDVKQYSFNEEIWIYIMLSGGHFAAAVFEEKKLIAHKTFHRYTIRAKRGTTQRVQDNKLGGNASSNSAGASLRRYNEAALIQDIYALLNSWKSHIEKATRIFHRCSIYNKTVIFNEKSPLSKSDKRLRKISVMVRRPILKEVKRLHHLFSTVEVYGNVTAVEKAVCKYFTSVPPVNENIKECTKGDTVNENGNSDKKEGTHLKHNSAKNKKKEKLLKKMNENVIVDISARENVTCTCTPVKSESELLFWRHLKLKIEQDNESFEDLVGKNNIDPILEESRKFFLNQNMINFCCPHEPDTLLHLASKSDKRAIVASLLSLGSNPSVKNYESKLPYHVSSKKEIRNEYRKFMDKFPDRYDYRKADVPSPLSEAAEAEKIRKAAEKKKRQKKQRKEKIKEERVKSNEENEKQREQETFDSLSDREKRAAMAERRFASQLTNASKCSNCRTIVEESKAFKRYEYLYCSTDCVFKHKTVIGK